MFSFTLPPRDRFWDIAQLHSRLVRAMQAAVVKRVCVRPSVWYNTESLFSNTTGMKITQTKGVWTICSYHCAQNHSKILSEQAAVDMFSINATAKKDDPRLAILRNVLFSSQFPWNLAKIKFTRYKLPDSTVFLLSGLYVIVITSV